MDDKNKELRSIISEFQLTEKDLVSLLDLGYDNVSKSAIRRWRLRTRDQVKMPGIWLRMLMCKVGKKKSM